MYTVKYFFSATATVHSLCMHSLHACGTVVLTRAVGGVVTVFNDDGSHSGYSGCLGLRARMHGHLLFTTHGNIYLVLLTTEV